MNFEGLNADERAAMRDLHARFPRTFALLSHEIDGGLARLSAELSEANFREPDQGRRIVTLHSGTKVEVRSGKVAVTS